MKILDYIFLTIIILINPYFSYAQLIDELTTDQAGSLNISEVIIAEGLRKETLYVNSRETLVGIFKSSKDAIQFDDKETGIVIAKGFVPVPSGFGKMWFTLKIQCKDGRYKYEFYDVYFGDAPGPYNSANYLFDKSNYFKSNGTPKSYPLKCKEDMLNKFNELAVRLKSGVAKNSGDF